MGKYDIAPLRPPTLATFRSWGSSAGAGRTRLTRGKSTKIIAAGKKNLSPFLVETPDSFTWMYLPKKYY